MGTVKVPHNSSTLRKSPGPGAYEHRQFLGSGSSQTIGVRRTQPSSSVSNVPGPAAYNLEQKEYVKRQSPQFKLPTSERSAKPKAEGGPELKYAERPLMGTGSQRTIGLPVSKKIQQTPGPGDYGGHWSSFHQR